MIEVTDEWLELAKEIEQLTRRASACRRILLCLQRRARAGANVKAAMAKWSWQLRRLNIEIDVRFAKLNSDGTTRPGGGN